MSDFYFTLTDEERREVVTRAAMTSGMAEDVIEKDIWLVWILQRLFSMTDLPDMAFKGGTALSKVFGVIERFSEDVDISVDYRALDPSLADLDLGSLTRSARDKAARQLRKLLADLSFGVIVPRLQYEIDALQMSGACTLTVDEKGEQIRVNYPSVVARMGYLKDGVLIELGGRNPTEPNRRHRLRTEISKIMTEFDWPVADVAVIEPTRTFWEKATLIHVECNRPEHRMADRMFRHWFDLSKLADHSIGADAIADLDLLVSVARHKAAFFAYGSVGYDDCLTGNLKLIPPTEMIGLLRADYRRMIDQRMFVGAVPAFDEIMARLRALEAQINERVRGR